MYLAYDMVAGVPSLVASNDMMRARISYYVHIYARTQPEEALDDVLTALRASGIAVSSWGADDYETDTGWHHVPILVSLAEKM